MKIRDCFELNPVKNNNKYTDFINYIDTSSVNSGNLENVTYLEEEFPSRAQRLINKGDILYSSVRPNLKHYYFFCDDIKHAVASTGFVLLREKKSNNQNTKFIYYFLTTQQIVDYLSGIAELSQATFPSFSAKDLGKVDLPNISRKEQDKIVDVISKYDLTIDNNNKRIKILEEMAENLYKEWFVRFRYPGYKNDEFDYQNPKGWIFGDREQTLKPKKWHFGELREIGEFVRGKNITADKMIEGDIPVISAGLSPSGMHNEANVFGKSLTISASGANAGYLMYHLDNIWAADCSYYQDERNLWFVYNSLKFLQPVISNMQAGAAQPHVYPKHVNKISIVIPDNEMIEKYCDIVGPLYEQIRILKLKNENLIKQRDLLLPRLMSGKLQVK